MCWWRVAAQPASGRRWERPARAPADALVKRNRVASVVIATKRGLMTVRAKYVVDCTGDADVAYYAGAETMIERENLMPMTLSLALTLTNIDKAKVRVADVESPGQRSVCHYRRGRPEGPDL